MAFPKSKGRFTDANINCGVKLEMKREIAIEIKSFPKVRIGVLDANNKRIPEIIPIIKNKMYWASNEDSSSKVTLKNCFW